MILVMTASGTAMQTIGVSEFKAQCLALMDQVARTGRPPLVTRNSKPVVERVPYRPAVGPELVILKGKLTLMGEILSPLASDCDAMR
jgi:prevent-host-death family protein